MLDTLDDREPTTVARWSPPRKKDTHPPHVRHITHSHRLLADLRTLRDTPPAHPYLTDPRTPRDPPTSSLHPETPQDAAQTRETVSFLERELQIACDAMIRGASGRISIWRCFEGRENSARGRRAGEMPQNWGGGVRLLQGCSSRLRQLNRG